MPKTYLNFSKLAQRNVIHFVAFIFISATFLVIINYFTLKTVSAVRAYIHGESQYSKGEKDAARSIIMYMSSKEETQWENFNHYIQIPLSDSIARIELTKDGDEEIIRKALLAGGNHEEDLDNIIWLFRHFHSISFMEQPIRIWKEADRLVAEKMQLANEVRHHVQNNTLTPAIRSEVMQRMNKNTASLTIKEKEFSENLGATAREINSYLFYFNLAMVILIKSIAGVYAVTMIRRLKKQNVILLNTNSELDKFVYSASHDLRAPLTSLKGLIEIAKYEDDPQILHEYLAMMKESLDKQDEFIREIIDFSRNKRKEIVKQPVNLTKTIEQVIKQHCYMPNASDIQITTDFKLETIPSDQLRLEIILNNLVSNAIKYCDEKKDKMTIHIKTYIDNHFAMMEVADNGIGIKQEHLGNVFEMFYVQNSSKGTGLGLYLAQETALKLQGAIHVESELHKGTKFTLQIPLEA